MKRTACTRRVVALGIVFVLSMTVASVTAAAERRYAFDIVPQELSAALEAFARATGLQVARFSETSEAIVNANAVVGNYTPEQALERMLAGSGLDYRFVNARTIAIVKTSTAQRPSATDTHARHIAQSGDVHEAPAKPPGVVSRVLGRLFACAGAERVADRCRSEFAPGGPLEEVVVTAQRRLENLQKTPLAVTAVTSQTFAKLGSRSVSALQMVAPNVQISTNGSGGGQIGMRGITTANTTDVGDPAVAFELDGIYQSRAQTQGSALFDVDRIEVLRGPQGTLYGRNATTGVINVISKKPLQAFSTEGYLEAGNYRAFTGFAALNVPLSPTVAVRGAFLSINHDPYYDNGLGRSHNYGDQHETAGRLHALIRPADTISVLLTGNYSQLTGNGGPFAMLFPTLPLDSTPYSFAASEPGTINLQQWSAGAVIEWALPAATLSYEGGVHTSSLYNFIGANVPGPAVTVSADPLDSTTQQHEVRVSNTSERFMYVAGLYYFNEEQVWNIYVRPVAAFLMPDEQQDSRAAYGQVTYALTDSLNVTAGLRYTKDRKNRTGGNYGFDAAGNPILRLANFADISSSKNNFRLGIDYELAPDVFTYVSYATGYKAGGFFDGVPPGNTYAPENVASAEIGLKSRLIDNRLQLNLAAFSYDYTDFQVSFQDRSTLITKTYNAQQARNIGVEIETTAVLSDADRVTMSVSYLHARYSKFDLLNGAVDSFGIRSYTGKRLPFAPDWGVNISAEHVWELANARQLVASVLSHWQSESDLEFHGFRNTRQGAYTRTDATLAWGDITGRYKITAFVRNAEDRAIVTAATLQSTVDPDARAAGTLAAPRTYGLRVDFAL